MTDKHTDQESKHARMAPIVLAAAACACSVTLTDAQIYSAATDPCIPDARPAEDVIADMEATGRRVSVRRHGRGATVLPGRVLLPPDWSTRSQPGQVSLMAHEWTHVCQQGDRAAAWVVRYALDVDHRAVTELAGIVAQGPRAARCDGLASSMCDTGR